MQEVLVNQNGQSAVFEIFVLMFISFVLGYFVRYFYEKFFLYQQIDDGYYDDFYDDVDDRYYEESLKESNIKDEEIENIDFEKRSENLKNEIKEEIKKEIQKEIKEETKEEIKKEESAKVEKKETNEFADYLSASKNQEVSEAKNEDFEIKKVKESIASTLSPYSKIEIQDLKIVDGIGPKIELLLKRNGVTDLEILSSTSIERLNEILDTAGDRYAFHNPISWAEQAQLALKGNLNELTEFQDYLSAKK